MCNYFIKAQMYCEENKYRFTESRQQVLQTIFEQNIPTSAYDILKILSAKRNIKPPTIYRAINFWLSQGFIHRVESINSYIICQENHKHTGVEVFICHNCGFVDESHICHSKILDELQKLTKHQINSWNIEIKGLCITCVNAEI